MQCAKKTTFLWRRLLFLLGEKLNLEDLPGHCLSLQNHSQICHPDFIAIAGDGQDGIILEETQIPKASPHIRGQKVAGMFLETPGGG